VPNLICKCVKSVVAGVAELQCELCMEKEEKKASARLLNYEMIKRISMSARARILMENFISLSQVWFQVG